MAIDLARKRARERAYYAKNREKLLSRQRFRQFGITEAQYKSALEMQDFKCAVCGTDTPRGVGDWHIDHCHSTSRVRGLLCQACNIGLGVFKDSTDSLYAAISYLKQNTDIRTL